MTTVALANVPNLDVHQVVQETLASVGPGVAYSRLLRLRTGPEEELPQPSLLLECDLCESWRMVDPFTYEFQLRQGVRWQDIPPVNGRELIAQDVVFSYERQREPGWANAPLLQNMRTVEATGQHTLTISLNPDFPDPDFLLSLANGHTKVVAREAVLLNGDLTEGPVIGSGPWKWDPERLREDIVAFFVKNPTYFEEGLPFADELVISLIKEEETRLAAFAIGRVDVYRVSPRAWDQLNRTGKQFDSFLSRQAGSGVILAMNVSRPPFDNHQVRQAVLRALDPWEYARAIWAEQGFVSLGVPVERPDWLLTKDEMRGAYFADPSRASDTLKGLGIPLPIKFQLTVADFSETHLEQGRRIQEDLRIIGFDPIWNRVNPPQYNDRVWRDKDYQLSAGELPPTTTTNSFLFAILHSLGSSNVSDHSDAQLDAMIDRQAVEPSSAERSDLIRGIQRHVLEQAYLFSPATGPVTEGARWVFGPKVRGFYPNTAASEYFFWAKTWVEE